MKQAKKLSGKDKDALLRRTIALVDKVTSPLLESVESRADVVYVSEFGEGHNLKVEVVQELRNCQKKLMRLLNDNGG